MSLFFFLRIIGLSQIAAWKLTDYMLQSQTYTDMLLMTEQII